MNVMGYRVPVGDLPPGQARAPLDAPSWAATHRFTGLITGVERGPPAPGSGARPCVMPASPPSPIPFQARVRSRSMATWMNPARPSPRTVTPERDRPPPARPAATRPWALPRAGLCCSPSRALSTGGTASGTSSSSGRSTLPVRSPTRSMRPGGWRVSGPTGCCGDDTS